VGFQVTEVQKALKGADYPADGSQLAERAEGNGAEAALVERLRESGARRYDGPTDVMAALKGDLGGDAGGR